MILEDIYLYVLVRGFFMKTRLEVITSLLGNDYKEIWDTCCDHGKLGISILQNTQIPKVHFVDCVPEIIDRLRVKLDRMSLIESKRLELHCKMAEDIKVSDKRSLICICGVGGVTAIDIITGLLKNNQLNKHDLLLSVQYKTPRLRRFLNINGFKVIKEVLCFEGKWGHEIIKISKNRGDEIDLIGSNMFIKSNELHKKYILKSITHYTKKCVVNSDYLEILKRYKKLL
jgi:tRNA (adenine22-N1)-methyltransferase